MPNRSSAKKHLKQTKKRTKRNKKRKKDYKKAKKELLEAIKNEQDEEEIKEQFITTQKKIDKAVEIGAIKENKGSRLKSKLQKKIQEYIS